MERAAGLGVAAAMICSGIVMVIVALSSWSDFEPADQVLPGLTIALLGFLTNGWLWRRYTRLSRQEYSAVMLAQQKLYRAKTSVDLCVVIALAAVAIAPTHPATHTVDLLGSIGVAIYLLWTWLRLAQSHLGDDAG